MDRSFGKTTTIALVEKINEEVTMRFNNLISNTSTTDIFKFPIAVNE